MSADKDTLLPAITEAVEVDADDVLGKMGPGIKVGLLAVSLGPPLLICSQNPDAFFGMLEVGHGWRAFTVRDWLEAFAELYQRRDHPMHAWTWLVCLHTSSING